MFIEPSQLRGNPSIVGYQRLGSWFWDPTAPAQFTVAEAEAIPNLEVLVQTGNLEPIIAGSEKAALIVHPRLGHGPAFVADVVNVPPPSDPEEPAPRDVHVQPEPTEDQPEGPGPVRPPRHRRV